MVVHEKPQFHEQGSETLGWQFMNSINDVSFVVHGRE